MSQCKKFTPNIFHKTKCSSCFRQKEEHSAEALECNRASRSVARSGYLFIAPDWDFSVPLNRTKRWQRRWFVLYDDGELSYSVDEHPDTVPQGSVDMCKVLEVTGAEQVTGHPHSLALTGPDRVTFVKAASREDARWWLELLAVFPRRHKRNATFPGGRASPSLPKLGRSASPQPPRPRHLSVTGPSPRANFETPPLKERESPPKEQERAAAAPVWASSPPPTRSNSLPIETPTSNYSRPDCVVSSGSPPTRDKLRCEDKARTRRDWRNERLRDIATALTDRSPESSLALPAEGLLHMKKGWLWMKTSDSDWVRRWIVLNWPTLQVYPNQDEQGTPELTVELSTVVNCAEVPTETKYGFEIQWGGPALTLSAVTQGIRANWLQALKKAAPISPAASVDSPISPSTPRSLFASSDEEYRTASEGGRRGSEDWSELPPSPPLTKVSLSKVKERSRLRPRLPRSQSRQSTLDSTSTDELDCAKEPDNVHIHMLMNNKRDEEITDLQKKLFKAGEDVRLLEEEIARLRKFQSDATIREKKAKEMLSNFEKTEQELNQRNSQIELNFLKEQRALQRRLSESEESSRIYEEKCNILTRDLQTKQRMLMNLQDELDGSNERLMKERGENDKLFKKIQELEGKYRFKSKMFNADSVSELINIDLDLDIDEMSENELKEYCLDLKCRFERAIVEIRAVRRALRESEQNCDRFELANHSLTNTISILKKENENEIKLLVQRLDHLTSKLTATEKQLKSKGKTESKDKRRSLSLKGRESVSINKEVEDKVTELEAKIIALERGRNKRRYKRERSSERGSPIDDRSLRRLRRKSLDSATASEPMKLLMRLSSLESKVTNVNASNESLNTLHGSLSDLTKSKQESTPDNRNNLDVEYLLSTAKIKVNECLQSVGILKTNNRKRASSPSLDRLISLENSLNELLDILGRRDCSISTAEVEVINTSAGAVVKQLQTLLEDKLKSLAEKKRLLQENKNWDSAARLQMLAEKVAYENILVGRIQDALLSDATGDALCDRLIGKEMRETAYLIIALQNKINGANEKHLPGRTSAEYLSKILAKCLVTAAQGFGSCKNFVTAKGPSIKLLCDEKQNLDTLLASYKSAKLPKLAESLAAEALNLAADKSCRLDSLADDTVNEFSKTARELVNAELIRSEINHVLLRAAQVFQSNIDADHTFFFSFFASERAALELWSDSVGDCLYQEVDRSIAELTELYQNSLNRMLKQNRSFRSESDRNGRSPTSLLHEYAEIVAHKALIDARIAVLSGKYTIPDEYDENKSSLSSWLENEKYWSRIEDQSLVQINQSLEAEFCCMVDKFGQQCFAVLGRPELEEVLGYLNELASKVAEVQECFAVPVADREAVAVRSWSDVCRTCVKLRNDLEEIRVALEKSNTVNRYHSSEENRLVYLGTEYLSQVENLRAAYRRALASCKEHHTEADIEQLQRLCESVLQSMEQWHRRTIQDMRDAHAREVETLKREKEQALAEETQATLAALDVMKKAHEAEVQREVAKFKQEFVRQKRDDIFDLSEKLSVKSLEASALEGQLASATRQLAHAQQHILKLERNPQISSMQN